MRRLVVILPMLLFGQWLHGQTESTLYFMNSVPQAIETNPAMISRYKTVIGLPGISSVAGVYANNGFSYSDMITTTNGKTQANLSGWTSGLADKNYLEMSVQTDLFRVGVYLNPKWYLSVSGTVKAYNRTMFQKGLATALVDGTAPLVNSYSNTSPEAEAISMMETNLGVAYKANPRLTVGGRLKFLKGAVNMTTESSSLVIQVDNNYHITATGSAVVRTSGWSDLQKNNYDLSNLSYGDYFRNTGWGLDLGLTYKAMDKLTLGVSLTDFGFINWKNNTVTYTLDPATANYTFAGIDVNKALDNKSSYFKQQMDTIQARFEMKGTPSGSYTTWLPTKFYLSGNYELAKNFFIGALFFGNKYKDRTSAGMTAALSKNFGKAFSATLSYTVSNRSYNNLGLGMSLNLSPVQFYLVGDNLLAAPASLVADQNLNTFLNNAQLLTLRTGINIVLGLDKGGVKKERVNDENHNPKKKSKAKVKNTFGRSPQKK